MTEPTSAEFESTPDEIEMSAYLDGELAASDAQRVEQKMADDEQYRQQLHSMQRAWDMLDELPTADVDDSFAQTTVEMISLAANEDLQAKASRGERLVTLARFGAVAGMLLSAAVGYFLATSLISGNHPEVTQLDPTTETPSTTPTDDALQKAEYGKWLASLSPAEATKLSHLSEAERLSRFESEKTKSEVRELISSLSPDEQKRMVDEMMGERTRTATRERSVQEMSAWKGTLDSEQLAKVDNMPEDGQLRQYYAAKFRYHGQHVLKDQQLPSELTGFLNWIEKDYVPKYGRQIVEKLPEQMRQRLSESSKDPFRQKMIFGAAVTVASSSGQLDKVMPLSEEDVQQLVERMKPEDAAILESQSSLEKQRELIRNWMVLSVRARVPLGFNSSRMSEYQNRLDPQAKAALEKLPKEERERALRRMMMQDFQKGRGGGFHRGGRSPRHGPPHSRDGSSQHNGPPGRRP